MVVLVGSVAIPAPTSRAYAPGFLLEETRFGSNQQVIIDGGALSEGCDGLLRTSDIYVIPAGSIEGTGGETLTDVSGEPNFASSAQIASQFFDFSLGWTAPTGGIGSGTYDIVEDVCRDGVFDFGADSILRNAFTVVLGAPGLPGEDVRAMKQMAGQRAGILEIATRSWQWFWFVYGTIPGLPKIYDGPTAVVKSIVKDLGCARLTGVGFPWIGITLHIGCRAAVTAADATILHPDVRKAYEKMADSLARIYRGIEGDPPDPNYTEAVQLTELPALPMAQSTDWDRAYEKLYHGQWTEALAAEAFLRALEKYQGAQQGADNPAALAQAKAVANYARQAIAGIKAQQAARQEVLDLDRQAGGFITAAGAAAFNELTDRIKQGGTWNADEVEILEAMGLDATDRQAFADAIMEDEWLDGTISPLADIDSEASVNDDATVAAFEDMAVAFEGIAAELEVILGIDRLTPYPEVTLTGPASATLGETINLTAATDPANTLAWDTDADGEFDDGTGTAASATADHLGPNLIGVRVTDTAGHQAVAYHTTDVEFTDSHPIIVAANPPLTADLTAKDGDVVAFEVTPGHTGSLPVTTAWFVNGEAVGTGEQVEVTADADTVFQFVQAVLTDSQGAIEWAVWELFTPPPLRQPPGLTAGFAALPTTGLVDVAWDQTGGKAVAASSVYSTSTTYAANNLTSARNSYWASANGQTQDQWVVIDLGADQDVSEVRITPYTTNTQPENVVLSTADSLEGPFTPFVTDAFGTGTSARSWSAPTGTHGRYLRAEFPELAAGQQYLRLSRIQVLSGQLGGPDVAFTDTTTGPAAVTTWAWDFGDGATSTEANPTHAYTAPGAYQVTLQVTDADGATSTHTRSQVVTGPITPVVTPPTTAAEGQAATISINTANMASLRVDWGDGTSATAIQAASFAALGTATTTNHSYADNGTYTITVTGTDAYGSPSTPVAQSLPVANRSPSISGVSARYELNVPQTWSPSTSVSDAPDDRASLQCEWDYGDGQTATGLCSAIRTWQPHAYQPGVYTATLTATDKDGGQIQASAAVTVKASHYVNVYPVAGTATAEAVTVRVKVWNLPNWTEAGGVEVTLAVAGTQIKVTTDEHGLAQARVPRQVGQAVDATVTDVPGTTAWAGSDSNDLSTIGKPQGDVLFLVDDSGSMGGAIAGVRNNIDFIADRLDVALDYQIGVMPLNYANSGPRILVPATDSLPWIHDAVARLNANGSGELGPDGIVSAFDSRTGLRPEAASCLVLVADEPTQWRNSTVADATRALEDNDTTLFSIVTMGANAQNQEYRDMATNSGGAVFDIAEFVKDPQPLLAALTTQCVASVAERPDLSVTIDDGLTQIALDEASTHTVTVTNDGLVQATGVEAVLDLTGPAQLGTVSGNATVTQTGAETWRVTWPAFTLPPGDSISFTVPWSPALTALPGEEVVAAVEVADDAANGADLSPANNQATDSTALVAPPEQSVSVVYVDDDAGSAEVPPAAGTHTTLVGRRLTPVGFAEADAQAGVPENYALVSVDNVDTYDDDAVPQTITVHLRHQHTLSSLVTTRTIEYTGAGSATPGPVVQQVVWLADTDLVTAVTLYSSGQGYPEVASPAVPAHGAVPAVVPATGPAAPTQVPPADQVVTVTYHELSEQSVAVVYVDDDAGLSTVTPAAGAPTALVGRRLTPVGFTEADAQAAVPEGYVLVSIDNVETYDDDDAQARTITVHLAHRHTLAAIVVTRVVEYSGAGAATPEPVIQEVLWQVDTDDVTGVSLYSASAGFPGVPSPAVPGFAAAPQVVPATGPVAPTATRPGDSTVTVAYVAIPEQLVSVVYVDDDAGASLVTPVAGAPTALVGRQLTLVGFTEADAQAGMPEGYVLVSVDNVETYDADDSQAQTITVHLAHHHTLSTVTVIRTIQYGGAGEGTPEPVVQEVLWYADTDDVTGVTLYWSAEGYPQVESPAVDGHVADRPLVAATDPAAATGVPPVDFVELVAYQPLAGPPPATATPAASTPRATATPSSALPLTGASGALATLVVALIVIAGGLAIHLAARRRTALR
jgi:PKD repeat protein